jgi:hypothetical protein
LLTLGLCGFDWQGLGIECQANSLQWRNGPSSRGFDDGSDIGIEVCTPSGSKAVGDFSEGHAGPQRAIGLVVCGLKSAIGEEDKHIAPDFADGLLQLDALVGLRADQ